MKILSWVLVMTFFSSSNCFSQDTASTGFQVNEIPKDGLLLDNGWKYHAGDNGDWAKKIFDDASWLLVNPTRDIHDFLQFPNAGIFWLRLHIRTGNYPQQILSFLIQQSGASEIYLDDSLICKFGNLSEKTSEIKAYDPLWLPKAVYLTRNANHILAVRYVFQPHLLYTKVYETANPLLWIKIMDLNQALDFYYDKTNLIERFELIPIGILLMMFVLHLAFFLVYRSQTANLYFAIFALSAMIGSYLQLALFVHNHSVGSKFYLGNISIIFYFMNDLLLLTAIQYLLKRHWDFAYRASVILMVIVSIFSLSYYKWGWRSGPVYHILIYLNIIRISVSSIFQKKRGAWIIAIGLICSIVFFIAFIFILSSHHDFLLASQSSLGTLIDILFILSLPASVSLFLALDFAFTNRSLEARLRDINDLSEKNIAQEREKQQLLLSQNDMLENKVKERTLALSKSIEELKSAQFQLIQAEKMASLGELTAGIAHEIQNPLNFVNNFAQVNAELIDEAELESDAGNPEEVKKLLKSLKDNQIKINQHGQRAEVIVKGMLQHARISTEQKEPSDLNAIAEEYLRMSYNAARAKDTEFNANLLIDLDTTIGKVSLVPKDIGRVLLNIYNNAFYTVTEKKKQQLGEYEPNVSVSTKKIGKKVEIRVKDNGNGISQKSIDKIFQPFFTTKPAGLGTGLGLSLSYDILKAHGGEIKVDTQEREFTEFTITLPA